MVQISSNRWLILVCLALALSTAAVYWPAHRFEFISYDDPDYVTENETVQSGFTAQSFKWAFTTGCASNWHPLTWLSLMLDAELFGQSARAYHITNVLLHIANTLLLFLVLTVATASIWPSAFVAAAFALHPMHVESVAWIAERKDVLSTLFWLLTMAAYIRYASVHRTRWYLLAIVAFALGLMSKPMLVTLPFVLLLLDYWPLERFHTNRSAQTGRKKSSKQLHPAVLLLIYEKIPFFVLAAISSFVTFYVQDVTGATRFIENLSLIARLANALISYVTYICRMIWPAGLAVLYPHPGENVSLLHAAFAALLLAAVSAVVLVYARRSKYLAVGWLWYLGTLVPVIGLVQVGKQAMADRYTYIPYIGLFIMIAWLAADLLGPCKRRRRLAAALSIVLVIAMAVCSRIQLSYWPNSMILFERAVKVTKDNAVAQNNLGAVYFAAADYDKAASHAAEAVRIDPNYMDARRNLGSTFLKQGRVEEAVTQLIATLKGMTNTTHTCNNLAWVMATQPDSPIFAPDQAVRLADKVCQAADNRDPFFLDTLAAAYAAVGNFPDAMRTAQAALRISDSMNQTQLSKDIRTRLNLYIESRAYTEPPEKVYADFPRRITPSQPRDIDK